MDMAKTVSRVMSKGFAKKQIWTMRRPIPGEHNPGTDLPLTYTTTDYDCPCIVAAPDESQFDANLIHGGDLHLQVCDYDVETAPVEGDIFLPPGGGNTYRATKINSTYIGMGTVFYNVLVHK